MDYCWCGNYSIPSDSHSLFYSSKNIRCVSQPGQELQNPNALEGSLAYLAPEQTGRMNRGIDYRADFYGLGITLYELLTGQLPFAADDPMELLHCHIAQCPIAVREVNNQVPKQLSAIVSKLLAKNAEERYQSALGLKHDLQICFRQWNESGRIEAFALGQRDLSDRFLIPEKLYGREAEVKTLLAAFERVAQGSSELMLIAGFSGIGKTAVVNEVHKPITQQKGYFIKGKFDQLNRNIPFSAFVQAFRGLMRQLISESDNELAQWKTKILNTVGENGQVLLDVIPELEQIIGPQPPVLELSGSAAQNRFNLLLSKFLRLFATPTHPLVIFLDDLQWVDSASLSLLTLLMDDSETQHLLVLGAYRDNEVFPAHPLMLALEEIERSGAELTKLTLAPLTPHDIDRIVADTFLCSTSIAQPFSQLVYQKTQGNPFFTTQFLQGLHREGWITFDATLGYWQCNLSQVQQLALTDDVVAFMEGQLQKLPSQTQSALKFAACIGNRFDLSTLAVVCEQSPEQIAADLWRGLQSGFVIPESEIYKFFQNADNTDNIEHAIEHTIEHADNTDNTGSVDSINLTKPINVSYRFLHDRVQQAAYNLIPQEQKQVTHWQIGQRLLQQFEITETGVRLFEIVNQLNAGRHWEAANTEQLITLNLQAGQKAKAATAYAAALDYFQVAHEQLPQNSWAGNYPLTLAIYQNIIEAAYLNLRLESVSSLVEKVLGQAHNLLDKIKIYEIQIQDAIGNNQLNQALDLGLDVLMQLGVPLVDPKTVEIALPSLNELEQFPVMSDPHKQSALRIFVSMFSAVYNGRPALLKPTIWTMVHLCTTEGHTSVSPMAYTVYGMSCCGSGAIEEGYLSGQIALKLLDILDTRNVRCKALEQIGGFISHWKEHVSVSIEQFNQGLHSGLDVGDLEYACHSAKNACAHLVLLGLPLQTVQKKQFQYIELGRALKQQHILSFATIWQQLTLNLIGQGSQNNELKKSQSSWPLKVQALEIQALGKQSSEDSNVEDQGLYNQITAPWELIGESFNEREMLPILKEKDNFFSLYVIHFSKLMLSYLFGNIAEAKVIMQTIETYTPASLGTLMSVVQNFYASLILLQDYREQNASAKESDFKESDFKESGIKESDGNHADGNHADSNPIDNHLTQVASNQAKMKVWANFAPMNHLHKYQLVEAERCHATQDHLNAIELYEQAIAGAKTQGYLQEEALANELAAQFYLGWGKEKIAVAYMQEAYYCYARWGAKAKTEHLERQYPKLLAAILLKKERTSDAITTLNNVAPAKISKHSSTSPSSSNHGSNERLDLTTVLKSAQAFTENIELDELIPQISQLILRLSGADQLALLMPDTQAVWQVRVNATPNGTQIIETPLSNQVDLPVQLIQYVKRTQEILVLEGQESKLPFIDPFLEQYRPSSVACLPIIYQGNLSGLVYLQNQATAGVFTRDRIIVVNFLCHQAAIALENAKLFTAKSQIELSLRDSMMRLQRIANNLPGIIYRFRYDANHSPSFPFISARSKEILGIEPEALQQSAEILIRCIAPEDQASYESALQNSMQMLKPFYWCGRLNLPTGKQTWVEARSIPSKQVDGSYIWDGVVLDISEQKAAERQLYQTNKKLTMTNQKLRRATQLKDEFLANMSHELRTPLNSVIGFSQLMQQDGSLSEKHKATLSTINRSGEHLLSLINDILEMSKIESGRTTLNLSTVDLPLLLDDLREMLRIKAEAKQLFFKFSYSDNLPRYIEVDEVKLRQILLNLLSNALKFTARGKVGFYAIALTPPHPHPDGKVSLRFSITDTGPGISKRNQKIIFQPFVQASAGKQSHQGTGLGLPISQKFAKMMGGNINVDSIKGQGSTFHCDIYVHQVLAETNLLRTNLTETKHSKLPEQEQTGHQRVNQISPSNQINQSKETEEHYRILVVDDNPDNRRLLSQMLSIYDFQIETASNGLEAIEWNQNWHPDLIWMDIRMPIMDGLEAIRRIRRSSHQPKIVAITANAFLEEQEAAFAEGCDDFITKPFSVNEIFERLEKWLDMELVFKQEGRDSNEDIVVSHTHSKSDEDTLLDGVRAMPQAWQERLKQEICSLNDEGITSLLAEVPEKYLAIVEIISTLQAEYRYDVLVRILGISEWKKGI